MFINWPLSDKSVNSCDLLDGTDFSDCRIVFFDPLEFAVCHGLRPGKDDISAAKYIACTEEAFMRYLAGIKAASKHIRAILNDGGILVIRSQIPNSQFTIRKKSSVGARTYTESLVSPFFWLEEFLGKCNFNYCNLRTVKYLIRSHPLRRIFGQSAVNLLQTQNSIADRHVEVIAAAGLAFKSPAISRVTCLTGPGQIYLIPQFEIEQEHLHLIDAFERIIFGKASGLSGPKWLDDYEVQIESLNPFRPEVERLDKEISALENRKVETLGKLEATTRLVDLLAETDAELGPAALTAMELLGFECSSGGIGGNDQFFEAVIREDMVRRAIVKIASSDYGPIRPNHLDELNQTIEAKRLRVRPKGILIGNASRFQPPPDREIWFDSEGLEAARRNDFCLMPSHELYTAVCHVLGHAGSENLEDIKASLRQDILDCDSQFALNRRRYGI